jgi:glycosyltransferase involved in cell wall biosynthesis
MNANAEPTTLLCLSHLNWDHVWQRPQQLMTRLARTFRVVYVDPPQISADLSASELRTQANDQGVLVLRPFFPTAQTGDPAGYWSCWHALLPSLLDRIGQNRLLWVFSPMAHSLVERARSQVRLVVYDCMDDLASFKGGDPAMRDHETRLLALADLVFTGGASMYAARKARHPRVFCFPSGVDVDHYRQRPQSDPSAQGAGARLAALPQPRLGYFGVLDERIDWPLIAEVARRRPAWHWTLVGPTAKVDPAELPQAANIHYLGQQPYAQLPALLQQFDIATMPFALNEATRFISPTKTLEYLAGGRPVISSSVPDVVAFYREIVSIADGADAWIAATEQLLASSPQALHERLERAAPILAASSWDAIAAAMAALIAEQLAHRSNVAR